MPSQYGMLSAKVNPKKVQTDPLPNFAIPDILSVMADRTGIANGTLRPCIYFSRIPDMYVILPPMEVGGGLELARMVYELKYKRNWIWCEATTLPEIDRLQKRLTDQKMFESGRMTEANEIMRERVYRSTGEALRAQMVSSGTSEWEKDAIRSYFKLRGEKRDQARNNIMCHNYYIMAREMNSTRKADELLPIFDGQFERTATGGTPTEVLKRIEEKDARAEAIAHG